MFKTKTIDPALNNETHARHADVFIGTLSDQLYGGYTLAARLPEKLIFNGPCFLDVREPDAVEIKLTALIDFLTSCHENLQSYGDGLCFDFWSDDELMCQTWKEQSETGWEFSNVEHRRLWLGVVNKLSEYHLSMDIKGARSAI